MTRTLPAPTRAYAEQVDASAPITFLPSTPNWLLPATSGAA